MNRVCTIQASAVRKILNFAARYGVSDADLFHAVGLDAEVLSSPDHRIPFAQVVALYEAAARLTRDDTFGIHLGESIDPRVFDVLGYAAINSATFGEAIERVARYHSIWTDGAQLDLQTGGTTFRLTYRYVDSTLGDSRQDAEMTLAAFVALGRVITATEWTPQEIRFAHPAPGNLVEYQRVFRCPVRFAAEANQMLLETATLQLPIAKADPGLCAVLDRHATELLARYPRQDLLIEQVRRLLRNELNGGDPSLERIAGQLGMSARTLQRRLRDHNTSHHELLDEMRRELAIRYLNEPSMALCEMTYLLGFSERSAFHRAFKRWTGTTPGLYRGLSNQKN